MSLSREEVERQVYDFHNRLIKNVNVGAAMLTEDADYHINMAERDVIVKALVSILREYYSRPHELVVISGPLTDIDDLWKGYKMAMKNYSWWKGGVRYVGWGQKTLKEAIKEAEVTLKPSGCGNKELKAALLLLLRRTRDCPSLHLTFDGTPAEDEVAEILGVDSTALEDVLQK